MCRQLAAAGPQQHSRPARAGAARRARLAPGAALAGVARREQAADTGTGTTPAAKTSAAEAAHAGATTRLSLSPSDRNAGAASRRPGERGDCAALPVVGPERRRGQRDGEIIDLRRRHRMPHPGRTRRAGGRDDDDQDDGPVDRPGRQRDCVGNSLARTLRPEPCGRRPFGLRGEGAQSETMHASS